jgi:hypothetical protein
VVWKLREIPPEERAYLQKKFLNSIGVKSDKEKKPEAGGKKQEKNKTWTQEEDEKLVEIFTKGKKVSYLAVLLERKPCAISSRLKKLGLLEK